MTTRKSMTAWYGQLSQNYNKGMPYLRGQNLNAPMVLAARWDPFDINEGDQNPIVRAVWAIENEPDLFGCYEPEQMWILIC